MIAPNLEFDRVAASIAGMPHEIAGRGLWLTIRKFARDAPGSLVAVFLRAYGEVIVASGGAALIAIEKLARETGVSVRTVTRALDRLERDGFILAEHLDRFTRRVTMPCLLANSPAAAPLAKRAAPDTRVLH